MNLVIMCDYMIENSVKYNYDHKQWEFCRIFKVVQYTPKLYCTGLWKRNKNMQILGLGHVTSNISICHFSYNNQVHAV